MIETILGVLILSVTLWAQSPADRSLVSSGHDLKTFTGADGTFRIAYPKFLVRCARVKRKNGLKYSYFWDGPGCSAYIPPCSDDANAGDQPLLCLAYPPGKLANNPTFNAAVLTVGETKQSEQQCLSGPDHPSKSVVIRGVQFAENEEADAASNHSRKVKTYTSFRDGTCYVLAITIVSTSAAAFDPPVKELTQRDWEEIESPLRQARDSFEFLK